MDSIRVGPAWMNKGSGWVGEWKMDPWIKDGSERADCGETTHSTELSS
jgi:hypothetical protein